MANQEMVVHKPNGGVVAPVQSARDLLPAVEQLQAALMESVLVHGDLAPLKASERMDYYRAVCESLKLNPLTKPFEYLQIDNKLVLYVKRDGTDQLSALHKLTRKITSRELVDGVYIVTAKATTPDGREEESTGAVPLVKEQGEWRTSQSGKRYFQGNGKYEPLKPEDRANALMKAETKAKRRVTLSICGLGFVDESEIDTLPNARRVSMEDAHTLDVLPPQDTPMPVQQSKPAQQAAAAQPQSAGGGVNGHAPAPPQPEAAPADPLTRAVAEFRAADKYARLQAFQTLKKDIVEVTGSDVPYYDILGRHGVAKSDQFKTLKQAADCFREMWAYLAKCAECAEPPPDLAAGEKAQVAHG